MSYILIFIVFGSIFTAAYAEIPSENTLVEERLIRAAEQLSLTIFLEVPEPYDYLNFVLVKNAPHKMNLSDQLTKVIHEWSPRLLSLDPTSPYYFSNFNNASLPHEHHNLLSYFRAIESNTTLGRPFVNVLPQSYRDALPLLSMHRCEELVHPSSSPFFHNIELFVGPGQAELPFERESGIHSRLYCSLYGWPHFVLVNQTKQPTIKFDAQTLLSYENMTDIGFVRTTLAPGSCLFVPADWVTGIQLNNSISMVLTLKKIEPAAGFGEDDFAPWPCTKTDEISLGKIAFAVPDTFNGSQVGILVYFYQYLNPPKFNQHFTSETFLEQVRLDRNLTQMIMKWTPELIDLIQNDLFKRLDLNEDGQFNGEDYFAIKQPHLDELHRSIQETLERLQQAIVAQYNEMRASMTKMAEQLSSAGFDGNMKENIQAMIDQLPEEMKARLKEKNIDMESVLHNLDGNKKRSKRPSNSHQREREDDTTVLFDKQESMAELVQDEEEEITAEPMFVPPTSGNDTHRIEL